MSAPAKAPSPQGILGRLTAPAKINLALDILGPRPDGYHDMSMVMQSVALGDQVSLRTAEAGFALLGGDGLPFPLPEGAKSMEERTAEAFFSAIGRPLPGLAVVLEKRVPAYAGLGGGSADVAALLLLLRDAYVPELPAGELERIGLTVGSDVPFCVRGGTCLAQGRGEILTDLPSPPPCWIVLCKPDFGIPTPSLFARVQGRSFARRPDIPGMIASLSRGDLEGVAARLGNVFEEILPEEYSEVFRIKERLLRLGALNAAMSGSGPTVFGLFREEGTALSAAEALGRDYPQTFLTLPQGRL